jgi:hypothetical protein
MANDHISALPLLLGDTPSAAVSACAEAVTAAVRAGEIGTAQVDWAGFAADVGEKIEDMFNIDLVAMIVGAWGDFQELKECANRSKHPADETISLPLVDHTIDASYKPYLDIAIGELPPMRVDFEITFDIELHGVTVKIRDAVIHAIRLGSCRAGATVKCEGATVFQRKTRTLDLPGEVVLPKGIPISPHEAA